MIEIYTDGSASKNRSGWGFVALVDGAKVYEKAGTEHQGDTNQRMEIIAVMEACDWAANSEYMTNNMEEELEIIVFFDTEATRDQVLAAEPYFQYITGFEQATFV